MTAVMCALEKEPSKGAISGEETALMLLREREQNRVLPLCMHKRDTAHCFAPDQHPRHSGPGVWPQESPKYVKFLISYVRQRSAKQQRGMN